MKKLTLTKALVALLALFALIALLCSCDTTPAENTDTTVDTTEEVTTTPAPTDLVIFANNEFKYSIVRAEGASEDCVKVVQEFSKRLKAQFGVFPTINDDWKKPDEEYPADGYQIILGATKYPESQKLLNQLSYGGYSINVVGNRIYLAAWDSTALENAIDKLYTSLENHEDGSVTLPSDFSFVGKNSSIIGSVPVFEGGEFLGIYPCGDGCYMFIVNKASSSLFSEYQKKLEGAGYSLYTERTAAKNEFATYTGNGTILNTYYTNKDNSVRIIVDPEDKCALPLREQDVKNDTAICDPAVNLVGLGYKESGRTNDIGLFMIYTLPDGRLIVIDGGYYSYNDIDALKIFTDALKACAPDPNNITIATWVLTHAHADHAGTLYNFSNNANKYKYITVESFLYNFPTAEQYGLIQDDGYSSNIREKLPAKFPNAKIIKAHTGQVLHYGNGASLEVIYTFDDYRPSNLNYHNTSSLVTRFKAGGTTVMSLGDATHATGTRMVNMYGTYLRSDIVQLSHHGVIGITANTYTCISAKTVLWPSISSYAKTVLNDSYNAEALRWAKDLYVADKGVTTLKLPYTLQNNKDSVIAGMK